MCQAVEGAMELKPTLGSNTVNNKLTESIH